MRGMKNRQHGQMEKKEDSLRLECCTVSGGNVGAE